MNTKNIEEKLLKTIEKFLLNNGTVGTKRQDWPAALKERPLTVDVKFKKDLGMDSLDSVELLLQIEEEYDIRIDAYEFKGLLTLRDMIDHGWFVVNGEDALNKGVIKKYKEDEPATRRKPKKRGDKVPNPTARTKN